MASNVVMITGASSGIGLASARLFLERGWSVIAGMRTPAPEKLPALPDHRLMVLPIDVTAETSIRDAVDHATHRFGRIDVLVNNAGYGLNGPLEGWAPGQLEHQFEVNLFGLVAMTRYVLPVMRAQKGGVVVNVSSIGGRFAFPFASAYHATKFAVEGLSESLRFELAAHGIRVKLVEPGGIRTNFITGGSRWASHPSYEPQLSSFRDMAERLNDGLPGPERVAAVILRAATDRSNRLRYRAAAGPYPLLNALLPDRAWRSMVGLALRRHAGRPKPAGAGASAQTIETP